MSVRRLFAVLIALAVFLAPTMTRFSEAYAAVPDHHSQMMTKGHCEKAPDEEQEQPVKISCCVQTCMAVAAEPAAPLSPPPILGSAKIPDLHSFLIRAPAEIATPPPRAA